ncbi:hydrolase [Azoarcus sp. KH32C]|uniref:hydrolase n=1 Tax=Azoarcus sp. KH32C TaxID=748247 RepID=UPI0018D2BB22|nr:hydrolase [Azoarcus sp. KH32C]
MHLILGWTGRLRPEFRDHWDIYRARLEVERRLGQAARRDGRDDEYEIEEVLRHWLATVCTQPAETTLPATLAEFELQMEVKRSFPDVGIDAFMKGHEAERTLFLSDFYMNAQMLGRLLDAKGWGSLVRDGIVSCDAGLNKRSGRLFQHVHATYGISPEEHVHIGDNEWSDVDAARQFGVTALHYLPTAEHADRLKRERLFSSREALFEHVRALCTAEAAREARGKEVGHAAAFRLGADAAPLFIGFALWIAEQAVVEKLDRIFFLTREGEFFYEVFDALFSGTDFYGHKLPASETLAVSRLSTFPASMRDLSIVEMSRIWNLFKSQSIGGLFATLGVEIDDFRRALTELGLEANDVIEDPSRSPELERLFKDPAFLAATRRSIATQRALVLDYLAQCGVKDAARIGVVDIGWRGTIQDNLALISPSTHWHGMYLGLRRFMNRQPGNASKSSYGPNENLCDESIELFEIFAALEMLCTSSRGSVVGYGREDQYVTPRRQVSLEENAAYDDFSLHFQQGVLLAVRQWQPFLERYVVSSVELRSCALRVWAGLRSGPGSTLAETFLNTPQHDIFGFGQIFSRNQVPALGAIYAAPFVKSRRREVIDFVRRVQWSAAIEHMQGIGPFHRWSLVQVFRVANRIKRYRGRMRASDNSAKK